ncbi:MAG TPA: dethiobiotin synthase [Conexibacter sp.]|jgi:dethiobiotin synthetase
MSVLLVSGTDTGVGKTVVTAALAAAARARGERVAVVKPAQTGVAEGEAGDLDEIGRLSGVADLHELARYGPALAPAAAARAKGRPALSAETIAEAVAAIANDGRDRVLVEGAGGLLVRFDEHGATLADVARLLGAPVLVVVRAGLGSLNHAALTCEALRSRGVACAGLAIGAWPQQPDAAERSNLDDFETYSGARLRGRVPAGAPRLAPATFAQQAPTWISTEGAT